MCLIFDVSGVYWLVGWCQIGVCLLGGIDSIVFVGLCDLFAWLFSYFFGLFTSWWVAVMLAYCFCGGFVMGAWFAKFEFVWTSICFAYFVLEFC